MSTETSRLGLDEPQATDNLSGFPAEDVQALSILDNAALYQSGTLAARSSVTPLVAGLVYRATDTGAYSVYNGTSWDSLMRASFGVASLTFPTSATQTNELTVTHGLGGTPQLVVPTVSFAYGFNDLIVASAINYSSTQFSLFANAQNAPSGTGPVTVNCPWLAVG